MVDVSVLTGFSCSPFVRDEDVGRHVYVWLLLPAVIEVVTPGDQTFNSYSSRESEIQGWDATSGEDLLAVS